MEWFKFNDFNSTNVLIIKEMPPIIKPKKSIEIIKVIGRNDNFHIDNKTYESYNISIICILTDMSFINVIKNKLEGNGNLELSTVPNRVFKATIVNQIDFSKYLLVLREFPLQLEIQPISYSKEEISKNITVNSNFEVGGTIGVAPILEVIGSGTLTINNKSIIFNNDQPTPIIVNCDLMNATRGMNNANNLIYTEEFPQLNLGENTVELLGVTNVIIKYKEGWL